MKNKIFKSVMSVVAVAFTIASLSMIFAWYTNVNKVGEIDAESNDISITYTINDSNINNEKSYKINNLAFFDLNNTNELSFFNSMKSSIKITINNLDNTGKNVRLSYQSLKVVKLEGDIKASVAYPAGIINNTLNVDIASKNKILDLLPANLINTEELYQQDYTFEIAPLSSATIYIHLFGVQEIPSSDNSFLINPDFTPVNYEFKLILEATNKKSNVVAKS